ncbi:hypothetical protein I79_020603 [Cricetulus griseus]|uniref:Uncharacterized protein n=1 Tax=Cricetulus griseus TaxID=10029 RepID=G3IAI1_CRIGR|nr:hypothetical protein I79_020603 [Cricetulus griseus]
MADFTCAPGGLSQIPDRRPGLHSGNSAVSQSQCHHCFPLLVAKEAYLRAPEEPERT